MAININNTNISGGTTVNITDSSGNILYEQTSTGLIRKPKNSSGVEYTPLFNVGWNSTGAWQSIASTNAISFNYTGGNGYYNVGGCYNTSNYRFTAPWTGMYLFKGHIYIYGNDSSGSWYTHPNFSVNDGLSTRRSMAGAPIRMRLHGIYASYGQDTDICELIYLIAGDYVTYSTITYGSVEGYGPYSSWSGSYMGSIS